MKISRIKVQSSMAIPIPAVFFLIIIMGVIESLSMGQSIPILELISMAGLGIIIGVVVWLPSAIICMIIERIAINERTTKEHIKLLLFVEAFIPVIIFNGLMWRGEYTTFIWTLAIAMLAQLPRWLYLRSKDRMYMKEEEEAGQMRVNNDHQI